jgi:Mg-chelatase subunit ChlD
MRIFAGRFLLASLLVTSLIGSAVVGLAQRSAPQSEPAIRGWLSDEGCARGRAQSGTFTATNPDCAKECVAKGKKIVLIDPERKMIFVIVNQDLAKKNVGDYVEIAGHMDLQAKTVRVDSLKLL